MYLFHGGSTYSPYAFLRLVAVICHQIKKWWRHHPNRINHVTTVLQLRGCSQVADQLCVKESSKPACLFCLFLNLEGLMKSFSFLKI